MTCGLLKFTIYGYLLAIYDLQANSDTTMCI